MHLKRLCFILPADFDDVRPIDHEKVREHIVKESSNHGFRAQILVYLRQALHRLLESKWITFCHHEVLKKQSSLVFHDTEGVEVAEKVGAHNPRIFSYPELYVGSNGFSEDEVLGSGGFGKVYRAVLPSDGTIVAVKCLVGKGEHIEKTFAAELVAVANLRHRNLVRLRGWCVHGDQLLLVYDYMPNRSLDRILFGRKTGSILTWERRKKIIGGLAAALFYLHEQLETQIIHRDVKASNVMLDSGFNARLGDFGLARWLEHELEYQTTSSTKNKAFRLVDTTTIGGTIGYLPPEIFQKRAVANAKSDVFSFGVVALEIASGRRAVDLTYPDDQTVLLDWVRSLSDEGKLIQAADSRLTDGSSYMLADIGRLIHLGLLCTLHDPQTRPNMKWILDALSGNIFGSLPDLPSFRSHPLYISLSSSTSNSNSSIIKTGSTFTASFSTTAFNSSNFVSANGETMYVTAEDENIDKSTSRSNQRCKKDFRMFETPRKIAYKEIISATNNFSDSNRVAEVDFGTAYHGFLDDSHHVIIKRLGRTNCPVLRMRFSNEFENLARLRHRNLVQLRGWCTEQGEMLVVYDYSPNRLLSHFLFHNNPRSRHCILLWHQRYNIIKSLASAIYYLHEEWEEQVIHRNITSSAVILDPDMNPRLGSFALAEFMSRNGNALVEKNRSARGIFGYMAPEYMESGEATTMADVYSFGVVLLEVVTGLMAVDFRWPGGLLVKRVHDFEARKRPYEELADWRLDGEYDQKELIRLIKLGMACTRSIPESRPNMKQIVNILDGHDKCLLENGLKKERTQEWRRRNASSLSLVRRIQAVGIH